MYPLKFLLYLVYVGQENTSKNCKCWNFHMQADEVLIVHPTIIIVNTPWDFGARARGNDKTSTGAWEWLWPECISFARKLWQWQEQSWLYCQRVNKCTTAHHWQWQYLNYSHGGGGGGALPYLGYTGTCRWIGYGFWPRCPKQGIQFDFPLS